VTVDLPQKQKWDKLQQRKKQRLKISFLNSFQKVTNRPTETATKLMTAVIMIARYFQKSIASK
jgi:hypothetical protein